MSNQGRIEVSLRTDQGQIRDHNEDFVTFREPMDTADEEKNGWVYIVADGVGGADAGEIASQFACERTLEHYLANDQEPDWGKRLVDAMQAANTDLRQMVAERNNNSRMATTMVAAVISGNQLFLGNVGDSRGYYWRNGFIRQITKDQSLVAKLVEEGAITEEEAKDHPRKNVILYSLGSERTPKIDLFPLQLEVGDILTLCSDGLVQHVEDIEIGNLVSQLAPAEATQALIQLANQRGGKDNISVAVLRYGTGPMVKTAEKVVSHRPLGGMLKFLTIFLTLLQTVLITLVWWLLRV